MEHEGKNNKILVINGPNINMLGKRETGLYGSTTLDQINTDLKIQGEKLDMTVETFQSNHEGEIVEKIQKVFKKINGIIINPGAYTHTSIAVRDALLIHDIPIIEVHISNIYKRESFRHISMTADIATGQIAGFGPYGYTMALNAMVEIIKR
jgi:3-dehydroquinate dehydratase-2